jgi:hypothetical protein
MDFINSTVSPFNTFKEWAICCPINQAN